MKKRTQKRLALLLLGMLIVGGATGGSFVARHQAPFARILAAMMGISVAFGLASIVSAFARAILGVKKPPPTPVLDPNWRETSRRTNQRALEIHEKLARRSLPLALGLTAILLIVSLIASREVVPALIISGSFFVVLYAIFRSSGAIGRAIYKDVPSARRQGFDGPSGNNSV